MKMIGLLTFLTMVAMLVVGYLVIKKSERFDAVGLVLIVISVALLFIMLFIAPLNRMEIKADIQGYYAFKETIKTARLSELSEIERASIVSDIGVWNAKIARWKYEKGTILDWSVPKEVMELEMLK